MGGALSRGKRGQPQRPLYASEPVKCCGGACASGAAQAAGAGATGPISLRLFVDATGVVRVELAPRAPRIAEEDLFVRVQLQDSFSPSKSIHLVLIPTDQHVQGELSHQVADWMGTPRRQAEEGAAAAAAAEEAAHRPRSPAARLAARLSPRQKGRSPKPGVALN